MRFFLLLISLLYSALALGQKPEVVVTTGHNEQINCLALNKEATRMASGGNDNLVKIWDMATARELRTLGGNDGRVGYVSFSPDGSMVGAGLDHGELKFYNVATGEVVSSYPMESTITEFGFKATGEVCFIGEDHQLHVADYTTGAAPNIIKIAPASRLVVHPDGTTAFVYDYQSNLIQYDLNSGAELSSERLFDSYNFAFTRMTMDPSGTYISMGFKDGSILVYNVKLKKLRTFKEHQGVITAVEFDHRGQELIAIDHSGEVKVWNLENKKLKWSEKPTVFGSYAILSHPLERSFLISDMKRILLLKLKNGKEVRTFDAIGNQIVNMAYDQQGRFVAIASGDVSIKLWDLAQNRINGVLQGFFPVAFAPGGTELVSMSNTLALAVWDPYTGEQKYTLDTQGELIQNLSYSSDGKYLAGAGFLGVIKVWDLEKQQLVKTLTGHVGGVYGTSWSPDGKQLVSAGLDQTIRVWDVNSGDEIQKLEGHQIIVSDVKYSPDGRYFASASWDKTVRLWDANSFELVRTFEGHTNMIMSISFSGDGAYLASCAGNNAVSVADNSVRIWNVATGEEVCHFTEHEDLVMKVIYQSGSNKVFSAGEDGMAKLYDVDQCQEVASLVVVNKQDYVLLTPDHYYTASKDALEGVSFRVGESLYPFEQFDLKLNRPDIVASRIGNSPQALIDAYYKAYQKRLKKMKFTEDMLGDEFHLPSGKILTEELPLTTDQNELVFEAEFWDTRFMLDRINVYVNDVPIYGVEGIDLRSSQVNRMTQEIRVPLIPGRNKIQISCLNERGAESLRQTHELVREVQGKVGDLHIIAIGVSNYKEERFKLDFAAKDAQDFINTLKKSEHLYNEVNVIELTDSMATVENIMALEEYLANTAPEDVVIMFFAGHGMLSREMEYFYGTYDIEFKNPLGRGLSYARIEQLFNKTRALKKLLIMDTCHSGEVETEVEESEGSGEGQRNITTKSFAAREAGEAFVGLENSYDLVQSLFSDIRKGTGATVISSAGGAEYAYESEDWQNGLFTYCFLNGLRSKAADLNGDGEIYISELRAYVNKRVSELSGGNQNPTYRIENITLDYQIW